MIILLVVHELGTHSVIFATGKSKTAVWRQQKGVAVDQVNDLLHSIEFTPQAKLLAVRERSVGRLPDPATATTGGNSLDEKSHSRGC